MGHLRQILPGTIVLYPLLVGYNAYLFVFCMCGNVLRVAAVGDFGALHCQPAQKFDSSTQLQFCTSPPIEATRCYQLPFFSVVFVRCHVVSVFVRWLGGSFAKLGFSVGLCGFGNVPPNGVIPIMLILD